MDAACNQHCSSCKSDCAERKTDSLLEVPHEQSNIKKVIGVISGKGGVGKTLVTAMIAVSMQRAGHTVAILDADVTGPSIPRAFGIKKKHMEVKKGFFPLKAKRAYQLCLLTFYWNMIPIQLSGVVQL